MSPLPASPGRFPIQSLRALGIRPKQDTGEPTAGVRHARALLPSYMMAGRQDRPRGQQAMIRAPVRARTSAPAHPPRAALAHPQPHEVPAPKLRQANWTATLKPPHRIRAPGLIVPGRRACSGAFPLQAEPGHTASEGAVVTAVPRRSACPFPTPPFASAACAINSAASSARGDLQPRHQGAEHVAPVMTSEVAD